MQSESDFGLLVGVLLNSFLTDIGTGVHDRGVGPFLKQIEFLATDTLNPERPPSWSIMQKGRPSVPKMITAQQVTHGQCRSNA